VETTEETLQRKAIFQDRQRDIPRWTLSELAAQLRTAVDEARRFEADSVAQDRPRGRWEERQAIERVRQGLAVLDTELALKPPTVVAPDTTVHDTLALLDAAGDLSAADPDTGLTGRQQCDAAINMAALGLSWLAVHGSH
jgi:glutathione S-transferase